jgi:acetyl esterase
VPVNEVRDVAIQTKTGKINARIYDDSTGKAKDLILFIHGGGWCIGSINVYEEQGRRIAKATGLPTMVFDYSLAPEYPFPRAHDESLEIARSIIHNEGGLNYERIILLGDSAGGNMALSVARSLAVSGEIDKVRSIVAVYPVTDGSGHTTASRELYSTGYYLTKKAMSNFTHALTPGVLSSSNPRLDLLHAEGWEGLPPTFILTAGFDPLRDEGEAMVEILRKAGVEVDHKRYEGAIHAFFALKDFGKKGLIAVEDVARFIETH